MVGIDAAFNRTHVFNSSINGLTGASPSTIPSGNASASQELDWLNENLLTYEKTVHGITALRPWPATRRSAMISGC